VDLREGSQVRVSFVDGDERAKSFKEDEKNANGKAYEVEIEVIETK